MAILGESVSTTDRRAWMAIRTLRNDCAGHPANRSNGKVRTFMGRNFGSYSQFQYERWEAPGTTQHPLINLGEYLDSYADELGEELDAVLNGMKKRWP